MGYPDPALVDRQYCLNRAPSNPTRGWGGEEGDGVTPPRQGPLARTDSSLYPPTLPMEGEGVDLIVHT